VKRTNIRPNDGLEKEGPKVRKWFFTIPKVKEKSNGTGIRQGAEEKTRRRQRGEQRGRPDDSRWRRLSERSLKRCCAVAYAEKRKKKGGSLALSLEGRPSDHGEGGE